jgi:hypothetical protein
MTCSNRWSLPAIVSLLLMFGPAFGQTPIDSAPATVDPPPVQEDLPECPDQLMYIIPPFHYYSVIDCNSGNAGDGYLVFTSAVATGCKGKECATNETPYARYLTETLTRTDLTADLPLPKDTVMALPFPNPNPGRLALISGYPKYVTADIGDKQRIFLVYRVKWYKGVIGFPPFLEFFTGVELRELPDPGTPTVTASKVEVVSNGVVKLTLDGVTEPFQALYKE